MVLLQIALCAQVVVAFEVAGEGPVRFGFPVPVTALTRGLRVEGSPGARLQWSVIQTDPGLEGERLWAEIAILDHRGRGRVKIGGVPPVPAAGGDVVRVATTVTMHDDREDHTTTWTWADGTVDTVVRSVLLEDAPPRDAGEATTVAGVDVLARRTRVRIPSSAWRAVGVLPRADGSGRAWRQALLDAFEHLPAAPGERGRGDYVRGADGETVTNLEFDTTLGLARLALGEDSPELLLASWHSCRHLLDVDLDTRSGLPFCHGSDHRRAPPELGHVWCTGARLVGCTFADRATIAGALSIARGLAARVRARHVPEGIGDRMRDEAWPLFELERALRFADLPPLRAGADAAAYAMLRRWDEGFGCFRYGEAETRSENVLRDRIWVTSGIALPALKLHAERTGDRRITAIAAAIERRAAAALMQGRQGVPVQLVIGRDGPFDAVHAEAAAEGFLLLDGLGSGIRTRALRRSGVRAGLDGALDRAHDDLATRFSIIARCDWVHR